MAPLPAFAIVQYVFKDFPEILFAKLGHAAPEHRCDDDGCFADSLSGTLADGLGQYRVDADRQVRAMLLDRRNGQDHDGVGFGLSANQATSSAQAKCQHFGSIGINRAKIEIVAKTGK